MIVTYHTIRRMREDLVSRFRFGGDPRSWTTVAQVREERTFSTALGRSAPTTDQPVAWVYSRPRKPSSLRLVRQIG